MSGHDLRLAKAFGNIARDLLAEDGVDATLEKIVEESIELLETCEHAGVDVVRRREVVALAPSSDIARRLDEIQVEVDQGPCLDALRNHEIYTTGDLETEDRWPDFASRAFAQTGIRSVMGFRLWVEEDTMGALNLYSTQRSAFDERTRAIGSVLAAHAAVALANARAREHLEEALTTRDLIGQAKGILMSRHDLAPEEAFERLTQASQHHNVKLRDVAQELVDRHVSSLD